MIHTSEEIIIVHTDGGSRGNPGPAAIGVVVADSRGRTVKTYGKTIGERTNNEAEYEAVLFALMKVKALLGGERTKKVILRVYLDSELVASQLAGSFKIEEEKLIPLFVKIWNRKMDFESVEFHHIPREKNKDADRLVNEALDQEREKLF